MSYPIQVVATDLGSHFRTNLEHFCKIYFMPQSQSRLHWVEEIANNLLTVKKIKKKTSNEGRPESHFIFKYAWSGMIDIFDVNFDTAIKSISKKYNIKIKSTSEDKQKVFNANEWYYRWISEQLSSRGAIEKEEATEFILNMLKSMGI